MYLIKISQRAEAEIEEIGRWYNKLVPGLDLKFYNDLDATFGQIAKAPQAFSFYNRNRKIRKCILKRFPYKVYYFTENKTVFVIAVLHGYRSSRFIRRRIQ